MTNVEKQIELLKIEIARQSEYINTHGETNDKGEYDSVWEEYKIDFQRNLEKLDFLKSLKNKSTQISFGKLG